MRRRDLIIVFACVMAAGALLVAAGAQLDSINAQREVMGLTINSPLENAPPALAFATVAMGTFRGLVVDILWMRADKLKEEGQFFDARQLAEWITTLQPRFAAVWEFQAWNMAYNISVTMPANRPELRWQWVKNGYELLRDKGIPLNPKSIELYRELGRIFQHKIGGISDDAHEYYKIQLAEAMAPLLSSEDNGLTREMNEYFEALVKAPTAWSQIEADPSVAPFIQALRQAEKSFADADAKHFVQSYLSLRQDPNRFETAPKVIDAFRGSEALKKFDLFAKAYQLRHEWKLDPALMQEVNQTYGPIDFADPNRHFPMDWRNADSQAIYWAVKALKIAASKEGREISTAETNTDRIVAHSLQSLFRSGKMSIFEGAADVPADANAPQPAQRATRKDIFMSPDLRMFDSYNKAILAIIEKHKESGDKGKGQVESLSTGHRNMLKNAVMSFYQAGIKGYALTIYNELRRLYGAVEEFHGTLDEYVKLRLREELDSLTIDDAREQIIMTLMQSYYYYAIHEDDLAAAQEDLAQQVYQYYMVKYENPTERIGLPEMPKLRYIAIGDFLNNDAYPMYIREGLMTRIKVEKPDLYKQMKQLDEKIQQEIQTRQPQQPQQQD
jgi:hypothetical protein